MYFIKHTHCLTKHCMSIQDHLKNHLEPDKKCSVAPRRNCFGSHMKHMKFVLGYTKGTQKVERTEWRRYKNSYVTCGRASLYFIDLPNFYFHSYFHAILQ